MRACAARRHLAGDVDVVLDRNGHTEQRAGPPRVQPCLRLIGLGERALGQHDAKSVELWIEPLDPRQVALDQLARAQLAGAQARSLSGDARERQLVSALGGERCAHGARKPMGSSRAA